MAESDPTRELRLCDACSKQLLSEQAFENFVHGGLIFSLTTASLEFLRLRDCVMCLISRSILEWVPTWWRKLVLQLPHPRITVSGRYVVSDLRQNIILVIGVNGLLFASFWVMSFQGLPVTNSAIIQKALPTD